MKNACISVRNISASYDGSAVGTVVTALTAGGYTADKIFLLDDADEREFAQTVIECKIFLKSYFWSSLRKGSRLIRRRQPGC